MTEEETCTTCEPSESPTLEEFEAAVNMARTITRDLEDNAEVLDIATLQDQPRFPPMAYHLWKAREHLGQAWHIVIDELRRRSLMNKK